MKDFFTKLILNWIGKRLVNYGTAIGGIASILFGLVGIISILFPDKKILDLSFSECWAYIAGGLAALGIGQHVKELKAEMKSLNMKLSKPDFEIKKIKEVK